MPRAATTSDPFNAIAEPRRRDILDYLAPRERPVGDIAVALAWRSRPCQSTSRSCGTSVSLTSGATAGRCSIARTPQALRPLHEWTSRFERYWRNQLTRIKERAERELTSSISTRHQGGKHGRTSLQRHREQTLNITQEIHVRSSLTATFAALLERHGASQRRPRRHAHADEARGVARRPLVPRPRRRQRTFLGSRSGHQAADAARDQRSAHDVVRRSCRTCSTG